MTLATTAINPAVMAVHTQKKRRKTMKINEGNYGERLYCVTLGTGFAWTKSFEVYAYNESQAVDLVADYVEEHHLYLYDDHYEIADLCEIGETVEQYARKYNLTCCGNSGIYMAITNIREVA